MPYSIYVDKAISDIISATATGIIEVDDSSVFYVGAEAWLFALGLNQRAIITHIIDDTHIQVRFIYETDGNGHNPPSYQAGSDATAFDGGETIAELDCADIAEGNFDVIVAAVAEGSGGNAIEVILVGDSQPAVASTPDLGTLAAGKLDTVVSAIAAGVDGDDITIALKGDGGLGTGAVYAEVGDAITITYESGISTVGDVEAAITADSTLIEVTAAGTGATVLSDPADSFTATNLKNGGDSEGVVIDEDTNTVTIHFDDGVSTVGDVETALAGATIIALSGSGTGATVLSAATDEGSGSLTGGSSPSIGMAAQVVRDPNEVLD